MSEPGGSFEVVMPRLGLTMTEAMITEWLKPEGAWVEKGQVLFALEHEKASLEIESPASGYLHILVPVGEVVPILTPIASLKNSDQISHSPAKGDAPASKSMERMAQSPAVPGEDGHTGKVRATPKARLYAFQQDVDLEDLAGSGPRGMIVSADIEAALKSRPTVVKVSPVAQKIAREKGVELGSVTGSGPRGQVMRRDVEKAAQSFTRPAPSPDIASLKGLRGIIANRLSESWIERPQVTLTTEADADCLVEMRKQIQEEWGVKVSYNALLVKITAKALKEFPYMNSQLTPSGIEIQPEINIGLAVDTERGLLVPVVRSADSKSLFEINDDLQGLAQRAVDGHNLPDDLSGGTFTVTNLGVFEIDAFTPIINPPECAILGVGRIVSKPVGLNGQLVLREMMALSLSFDHRLVDGAPAARFLQRIKTLIERCFLMGLERQGD